MDGLARFRGNDLKLISPVCNQRKYPTPTRPGAQKSAKRNTQTVPEVARGRGRGNAFGKIASVRTRATEPGLPQIFREPQNPAKGGMQLGKSKRTTGGWKFMASKRMIQIKESLRTGSQLDAE